ncbi:MAG: efflux RND transporter periplasmic adaptor subunit [Saprospiraceae bacterium]
MKKIATSTLIPIALAGVALTAIVCLLGGCGESKAEPAPAQKTEESVPVRTAAVAQKTIALPVHASGFLTSASEQRLSFKIGGVIKKIYVDEGDVVRPGQLLAVLDQTEINGQVALAQQGLTKAERDLGRVEGLYRDSSATLELLQNATTARDVAKENLGIAIFNQRYAEIRATEGGKVIKKLMNEGEIIGPGMPVLVVFGNGANDWVVKIGVPDRDWARLNLGMAARVKMDAYPDADFSGKITDLAPAADPANGLYPVEIRVAAQGKRFAPGLFAEVDIAPQQSRAYSMVPLEAIVEGDGREAFVFAIQPDGQSVRKLPVRVAFLDGPTAVVAQGLEGVSEVVTSGSPYLNERSRVRRVE